LLCVMGKKGAPSPPPPDPKDEEPVDEGPPGEVLQGDFIFTDGSVYKGSYLKNGDDVQMHGQGQLNSGPETFEGLFDRGMYKSGKYIGCSGAVYEGSFANNLFHGLGTYTWPDGRVYYGMWKDGFMHGRGQYKNFSFGADKIFTGFTVRGKFASNTKDHEAAKASFLAEYGGDYSKSATTALTTMAERAREEVPAQFLVPVPTPGGEEEKPQVVLDRTATEEVVAGPYPEADALSVDAIKAFAAQLAEGAERPLRVTVYEDQEPVSSALGTRLRREQLQHVGQAVEFTAEEPAPGAVCTLVFVNICPEYTVEKAKWKLIYIEAVPGNPDEAAEVPAKKK